MTVRWNYADIADDKPILTSTILAVAQKADLNNGEHFRMFKASGNFTCPPGVDKIKIELCGSGQPVDGNAQNRITDPAVCSPWVGRFLDVEEGQTIPVVFEAVGTSFGAFLFSPSAGQDNGVVPTNYQWICGSAPYGDYRNIHSRRVLIPYGAPARTMIRGYVTQGGEQEDVPQYGAVPFGPACCVITW